MNIFEKAAERLEIRGMRDEAKLMSRLFDMVKTGSAENERLRRVIEDHAKELAAPVTQALHARGRVMPAENGFDRTAEISIGTCLARHHVPFEFKTWSKDHQFAFMEHIAKTTGFMAAKAIAGELWTDPPEPVAEVISGEEFLDQVEGFERTENP